MDEQTSGSAGKAAERIIQLEAELESSGTATLGGDALRVQRAALHEWIDTVVAVVASPGVGRVSLIHANGQRSSIGSAQLPFLLSKPAAFE